MDINNCKVETDFRYIENEDTNNAFKNNIKQNILVVEIPLPGGKAVFEFDITSEQKNCIEKAAGLK